MTEFTIFTLRHKSLPDDVIRYLFDFLPSKNDYYKEMLNYFQMLNNLSGDKYGLVYIKLYNLVFKNIFKNNKLLNYILSKNIIFKSIYNEHMINNKKRFSLMDIENSFLHSIIMTMYH